MSSVLDRAALEESPLADLHVLANQLGVDGFRRLRKADLVDAIIAKQGGEDAPAAASDDGDEAPRRPRARRSRAKKPAEEDTAAAEEAAASAAEIDDEPEPDADGGRRRRGGRRGRRDDEPAEDRVVEGTVELQPNGSGFVRLKPGETSDDDVYVSAAQVKRCELVTGDTVAGPVRAPRRSERYPSMIRVDTINGKPADEVAEGTHFDDLPCEFPSERFALGAEDPTLKAIEWLTPIGRGSRVTIVGAPRAGKTDALRRLSAALAGQEGLEVTVVLAGVRPEEITDWRSGPVEPATALSFGAGADAQSQAVERAIDAAKRTAVRGGHAVVLVDGLDGLHPPAARKALAAARCMGPDQGSLTVIATASLPIGGETTVIALSAELTQTGRFPALDLVSSGTLRPELLVGDGGAEEIVRARAKALED
jgi:transcription termination factor Rho